MVLTRLFPCVCTSTYALVCLNFYPTLCFCLVLSFSGCFLSCSVSPSLAQGDTWSSPWEVSSHAQRIARAKWEFFYGSLDPPSSGKAGAEVRCTGVERVGEGLGHLSSPPPLQLSLRRELALQPSPGCWAPHPANSLVGLMLSLEVMVQAGPRLCPQRKLAVGAGVFPLE